MAGTLSRYAPSGLDDEARVRHFGEPPAPSGQFGCGSRLTVDTPAPRRGGDAASAGYGVRAGVVQTAADKVRHDPQLRARGYFVEVPHSRFGPLPVETTPIRFSDTPVHPGGPLQRGAPRWGEDNAYVYGELLGLSAADMADYAAKGII